MVFLEGGLSRAVLRSNGTERSGGPRGTPSEHRSALRYRVSDMLHQTEARGRGWVGVTAIGIPLSCRDGQSQVIRKERSRIVSSKGMESIVGRHRG